MFTNMKQKIMALVMLGLGAAVAKLSGDSTALVFIGMFAVPMFFSKKEWIV